MRKILNLPNELISLTLAYLEHYYSDRLAKDQGYWFMNTINSQFSMQKSLQS